MHPGNLQRGEIIAAVGGVLLAIAVFLPWYHTTDGNPNSVVDGRHGGFSAWDVHTVSRFLFLAAAAAPLILLWIVIRDHQLSWPRGELTAVVGITAGVLALVLGFVSRPGEPRDTIGLQVGWYLAVVSSLVILVGAAQRSSQTQAARKPPGVL
jgi:4-amino-4-deoxy-L-arabinose transferase-like glycosyltransferase